MLWDAPVLDAGWSVIRFMDLTHLEQIWRLRSWAVWRFPEKTSTTADQELPGPVAETGITGWIKPLVSNLLVVVFIRRFVVVKCGYNILFLSALIVISIGQPKRGCLWVKARFGFDASGLKWPWGLGMG